MKFELLFVVVATNLPGSSPQLERTSCSISDKLVPYGLQNEELCLNNKT